jgi:hypothetical protein
LAAPNFHLRLSLPKVIMDMLNIPTTSKAAVGGHQSGARRQDPDRGLHAPSRGTPVGSSARGRPRMCRTSWSRPERPCASLPTRASRRAFRVRSGCATRSSRPRAASSRTRTSGPAAARGRCTERGDVRPSCASTTARPRTRLISRRKPALKGAYEGLLGPEEDGAAAEALVRF